VSETRGFGCIVFDFDFTLADSSQPAAECIDFALVTLGCPPAERDRALGTIGLSLEETFRNLTGEDDSARAVMFKRKFLERADEVMIRDTQIFPEVREILEKLKARGIRLGIVSTKDRYMIEGILERDGLLELVEVIVGGGDVRRSKPDPEGLLMAGDRLAATPETMVYVGDSVVDAEAASRAGTTFVAVLSGVTPSAAFARFNPIAVLDSLSNLPQVMGQEEPPSYLELTPCPEPFARG